jgi:hypothetical protein
MGSGQRPQVAHQQQVEEQLVARYPDVSPTIVRSLVHREWRAFAGAPVQAFVPVLVERRVVHSLRS